MLFLGTSGYSFKDWVGTVYPPDVKPSQMLKYYKHVWRFNTVELNFTYYRQPTYKTIAGISRKIPGEFLFTAKAPSAVTHEYWKEGKKEAAKQDMLRFLSALQPFKDEGRLGPILFQFPYAFKATKERLRYLEFIAEKLSGENIHYALEFRNDSWDDPKIYDYVIELGFTPVTVDEPQLPGLFPYRPIMGKNLAYFRFHGRNPKWFRAEGSARYNYNYSDDELRRFALDVLEFLRTGADVFVFFNNCYMGQAVQNALRFRELVGGA